MITYEMILEMLAPVNNTFSCQPNIILNSSNFSNFSNIFDNSFYRYGMSNNKQPNNTLLDSINYCIDDIINDSIDENDLWQISNEIHINIIIFNFKNNNITATHMGEYFNPWRPTIYLANYDNWWEPIITKDTKIFSFSTPKINVLKNNILSNKIKKYNSTENIIICDNFMEIMKNENKIYKMESHIDTESHIVNKSHIETESHIENESSENTFIKSTFITNNTFSRAKLEKMKKNELIVILTNMNLTINIKKPTKKDIIKLICID